MQLLEDDNARLYSVWFRWGRGEFLDTHNKLLAFLVDYYTVYNLNNLWAWGWFVSFLFSGKSGSKQSQTMRCRSAESQRFVQGKVRLKKLTLFCALSLVHSLNYEYGYFEVP